MTNNFTDAVGQYIAKQNNNKNYMLSKRSCKLLSTVAKGRPVILQKALFTPALRYSNRAVIYTLNGNMQLKYYQLAGHYCWS